MSPGGDIELSDADLLSAWEAAERVTPVERAVAIAARAAAADERVAEWTVGRRDALLLDLHATAFGGAIDLVTACPACSASLELSFTADDVRSPCGDAAVEHDLTDPEGGVRLAFRLPASADLLDVIGHEDASAARRALAERCTLRASRDGVPVTVRELPETTLDALAARAAELDPQADVELSLSCAECGHRWSTSFDVADHVWRTLDARARSLLTEVATLATAFGWTEREVLGLPAARRRRYLELAGA
jgi:hypothetical protein